MRKTRDERNTVYEEGQTRSERRTFCRVFHQWHLAGVLCVILYNLGRCFAVFWVVKSLTLAIAIVMLGLMWVRLPCRECCNTRRGQEAVWCSGGVTAVVCISTVGRPLLFVYSGLCHATLFQMKAIWETLWKREHTASPDHMNNYSILSAAHCTAARSGEFGFHRSIITMISWLHQQYDCERLQERSQPFVSLFYYLFIYLLSILALDLWLETWMKWIWFLFRWWKR